MNELSFLKNIFSLLTVEIMCINQSIIQSTNQLKHICIAKYVATNQRRIVNNKNVMIRFVCLCPAYENERSSPNDKAPGWPILSPS